MSSFVWDNKYAIGIAEMDRQHKILFNIIKDLHDAMMQGKASAKSGEILKKLVEYTRSHFAAEEALMSKAAYAELSQHRLQHIGLMKQVDNYVVRHLKGELALNVQLMNFLRDWLITHIRESDRKYAASVTRHLSSKTLGAA